METQVKYQLVSEWNKPGSKWVKNGDDWSREKTGKKMAMVIMEVGGRKVTRHVSIG